MVCTRKYPNAQSFSTPRALLELFRRVTLTRLLRLYKEIQHPIFLCSLSLQELSRKLTLTSLFDGYKEIQCSIFSTAGPSGSCAEGNHNQVTWHVQWNTTRNFLYGWVLQELCRRVTTTRLLGLYREIQCLIFLYGPSLCELCRRVTLTWLLGPYKEIQHAIFLYGLFLHKLCRGVTLTGLLGLYKEMRSWIFWIYCPSLWDLCRRVILMRLLCLYK